jgi:hypothetical protein
MVKKIYFIPSSFRFCWLRDPRSKMEKNQDLKKHLGSATPHGTLYKIFRPPNPLLKVPDLVFPFKCQDPYGHGICEVFCSNFIKNTQNRQHRFPEKLEHFVKIKQNKTKVDGTYGTDTFFCSTTRSVLKYFTTDSGH